MPPRSRRTLKKVSESNTASDAPNIKRTRGRPMKRASELKPHSSIQRQQEKLIRENLIAEMADTRQPYQLSDLEALPVELIQQIFFFSLEVNMPRASPHIANVLSNPSIYSALISFAYFDHDGESPVETQLFLPAQYWQVSLEDKIRLQRGVLSCRWCTLDFLKSSMRTLSHLQMTQAWHRESNAEAELDIPEQPKELRIPQVANPTLLSLAPLPLSITNTDELESHFLVKLQPPANGDLLSIGVNLLAIDQNPRRSTNITGPTGDGDYLPRIMQWNSVVDKNKQLHKTVHRGVSILATRVLPDHILEGKPSWTESKLELLMLLRQGARFISTGGSRLDFSADALYEGMASAIKTQSSKALLVLLELHFASMQASDRTLMMQAPQPANTPAQRYLARPFTSPIPLSLFHLACAQPYPASSQLMSLLIREGIDSIPLDDLVLTAWAVRNNADEVARFLLQHMEGSHDYGLARGLTLFVNGMLSWRRRGEYPFPEMTFTNQIGYVFEGSGVRA